MAIVEAKKGEIEAGIGQCAAEMIAVQRFNKNNQDPQTAVYGAVTIGNSWKFLKLEAKTLFIQPDETSIEHIERILGVFLRMVGYG